MRDLAVKGNVLIFSREHRVILCLLNIRDIISTCSIIMFTINLFVNMKNNYVDKKIIKIAC